MADTLEDHERTVSIGGRTITNLRFADDIDGLGGEEQEHERQYEASTAFGMEISQEKTKLRTSKTNGISTEVKVTGEKVEPVKSLKYLGVVVDDE